MNNSPQIKQAAAVIRQARKVIALTGAGVSTESGIPDFRGRNGLWSRYDPMEYGTLGAFRADPGKVWTMLAELTELVDAEPNLGHYAMAVMEKDGFLQGIITQNIDGLHQTAGSRNVVEYHGSLATFTCPTCGKQWSLAQIRRLILPPHCPECGQILKPDIVFFDEQIPSQVFYLTEELLASADCLIVAGTSGQVMPAALIPGRVARQGGTIIEINLELALGHMADLSLANSFAETMVALQAEVSSG
ncbi:MAG: Sir2 family NAD-dependent protein deacetylase [Proteobacteria bacterium]|nr:Sir2 family NAD-dependent protein deacetylase [Pseudomonadota bacterium]MBU1687783.1 Sir2 family NAD-dependent protein deacetylase [Pseudomonadota bacterium]